MTMFAAAKDTLVAIEAHLSKQSTAALTTMDEEKIVTLVSRAIGCTMGIDNHQVRAMTVLKAIRGEWVPPKPSNPPDETSLPSLAAAAMPQAATIAHLRGMIARMSEDMEAGKLNRWLGYMQGVAVANGWLTLDDCKAINERHLPGKDA